MVKFHAFELAGFEIGSLGCQTSPHSSQLGFRISSGIEVCFILPEALSNGRPRWNPAARRQIVDGIADFPASCGVG